MASLMSDGDDNEEVQRSKRIEKKLDDLAAYMKIEGWADAPDTEIFEIPKDL